jgi:hypothetical protein
MKWQEWLDRHRQNKDEPPDAPSRDRITIATAIGIGVVLIVGLLWWYWHG